MLKYSITLCMINYREDDRVIRMKFQLLCKTVNYISIRHLPQPVMVEDRERSRKEGIYYDKKEGKAVHTENTKKRIKEMLLLEKKQKGREK